jgi:hypothetical protein
MNMILLTGLSLGLSLSVLSANNFYADKVTESSANNVTKQISYSMPDNGSGMKYADGGMETTRSQKESAIKEVINGIIPKGWGTRFW